MSARLATMVTVVVVVPTALPLAWIAWSALRVGDDRPPWSAFAEVAATVPLWRWLLNGLLIAGGQTVLATLLCSLAAFAIVTYRFAGRRLLLAMLVATALLPGPASITGLFEIVAWTRRRRHLRRRDAAGRVQRDRGVPVRRCDAGDAALDLGGREA